MPSPLIRIFGFEPVYDLYWWLSLPLWLALGWSAWIDARSGRVPNKILLPGALYTLPALGITLFMIAGQSINGIIGPGGEITTVTPDFWTRAATVAVTLVPRLLGCLLLGLALWGGNELWHRWRRQDSIGMGDVKWSMLAGLGFGLSAVLWAWVLAAWLGLAALGVQRWRGKKITQLYFAPYLFGGLLLAKFLPFFSQRPWF